MNIGQLARQGKVSIQTVRYYERIGILKPVHRRDSGYRVYDQGSLERLLFIRRAQELGFMLEDIRELLSLHATSSSSRERARAKALQRLGEIRKKISDLKRLESTLKKLVEDCERGSMTSSCPILDRMAGQWQQE